ncbi:hypothetical protein SEUCBS140593_001023 [Sporothrix eucalyptigena]|uniref:Uncharacterized protein n=1 Tax=Sporothrix eucalyptigena TaxID=1812306 RepID=A0ABP0AUW5_9PEZI
MSLPEVVPESSLEAVRGGHEGWEHGEKDAKYIAMADYKSDYTSPSVHYDSGLIPVHSTPPYTDDTGHLVTPGNSKGTFGGRKAICGLKPKIFWTLLGVGIVVLIAAVAGGVGGGMAAARSRTASDQTSDTGPIAAVHSSSTTASTQNLSPTGGGSADDGNATNRPANSAGNGSGRPTGAAAGTSKGAAKTTGNASSTGGGSENTKTSSPPEKTVTTGTTVVSTTTKQPATTQTNAPPGTTTSKAAAATTNTTPTTAPAPAPTFLNNETYSLTGFAFQAFSGSDYLGKVSDVIRDEGFLDLPFSSNSYVWLPNGADCCITFCSDDTTAVGWWCDERRQKDSSSAFPRVWIGCGSSAHSEHACS